MYTSRSHASRSTAGTIDLLPGATNFPTEAKQQPVTHTPELLPVSCGYFFSIVRNLLLKQRKSTLRYLLLHTKGQAFDKLVGYISYNSLADLLIEMMQINVVFEPPTPIKPQNGSFDEDDDNADRQSGGESDNEESKIEKKDTKLTEDQMFMKNLLEEKKLMVVNELIKTLGHKNQSDMEASLNAKAILIDLIETEKTFEIFMNNDAQMISKMVELAADPSNQFNQQYLLQVLLVIAKQLKPSNQSNNLFKDLDEDEQYGKQGGDAMNFDIDSTNSKNLLKFLNIVKKQDFVYHLLIMMNSSEIGVED